MKFLFIEELKKLHFISVIKILIIIFLRLTKTITHKEMKFRILALSEKQISLKQINHFVDSLDIYVHQNILQKLQDTSYRTLLATAAPMLYAEAIKKKYHFDDVIATGYTHEKAWKETIKEEKKNAYIQMLQRDTFQPKKVILYTDHHDDMPLMKLSDFTYLVRPSEKTKTAALDANIAFEILQ
jgi:phosphoserine phosphatase